MNRSRVLLTSHLEGDGDAGAFYRRLGFEYTGEVLGDRDLVMSIELPRE